jgi:hypothetical protein
MINDADTENGSVHQPKTSATFTDLELFECLFRKQIVNSDSSRQNIASDPEEEETIIHKNSNFHAKARNENERSDFCEWNNMSMIGCITKIRLLLRTRATRWKK